MSARHSFEKTEEEQGCLFDKDTSINAEEPRCRICFETTDNEFSATDKLISPCLCKGSSRFVHVGCLQAWRRMSPKHESTYRCDTCHYHYLFIRPWLAEVLQKSWFLETITLVTFLMVCTTSALAGHVLHESGTWNWKAPPGSDGSFNQKYIGIMNLDVADVVWGLSIVASGGFIFMSFTGFGMLTNALRGLFASMNRPGRDNGDNTTNNNNDHDNSSGNGNYSGDNNNSSNSTSISSGDRTGISNSNSTSSSSNSTSIISSNNTSISSSNSASNGNNSSTSNSCSNSKSSNKNYSESDNNGHCCCKERNGSSSSSSKEKCCRGSDNDNNNCCCSKDSNGNSSSSNNDNNGGDSRGNNDNHTATDNSSSSSSSSNGGSSSSGDSSSEGGAEGAVLLILAIVIAIGLFFALKAIYAVIKRINQRALDMMKEV
ncbi:hypothetical protein B0O80DRAFT_164200 [Mortierella sp. GBAus27b]|nr:hypothetical protein B0O80DRAFT_164200 [Mortierella sp. GBAus27b]